MKGEFSAVASCTVRRCAGNHVRCHAGYQHRDLIRGECFRVAAGGRTGLTSLSTAAMFDGLFLAPLFLMVPRQLQPPLILVGLFMITSW